MKSYLERLGYYVNGKALDIIDLCDKWYSNETIEDFHKRQNLNKKEVQLSKMNFAKRCCADDANLCEIISVAPVKETASKGFIEDFLRKNRFDTMYRKQLEKTSATGTVGAYIYLQDAEYIRMADERERVRSGKIRIDYVDADCIIPLSVNDDLITECAFCGTERVAGKERTTLVIFRKENELYLSDTVVFNEFGMILTEECMQMQLGEVKPFAIMQNAEVNNLSDMAGYGLPKIYNAIPLFKAVDLCYSILYGDLDKGEKLVFINELLSCINEKADGTYELTPQQKELFILTGERLPDQKNIIQEYNPKIRSDQITKAFELVLSLLSMSFGYGSKKYTFENGKITTATEYIGTKQDSMQELNKQRKQAVEYIEDIVHAAMWFSNTFNGTAYDQEEELSIEFDDSYIEDKQAKLESMRADALSFGDVPILKVWYFMEKYNIPEEEAKKYLQYQEEPIDDVDD